MIFPNLRCPGARPGPQGSLRRPALLKLLRVLSRWRQKREIHGPHTGRAANPVMEAST